jgi:protein-glutamine gamma-glutamyltransferase
MNFETLFKSLSYAAVLCGFIALWVSGTFGIVGTGLFIFIMVAAWLLEGSRWQISERWGTALIVAAMPLFYAIWRFGLFGVADGGTMVAGILARLILSLSAIKLLQRKSDRDWIFLYLMAFFEVLLAAGLSISALYLLSFVLFAFIMVATIILLEIRKTGRLTSGKSKSDPNDVGELISLPVNRLTATAFVLIGLIIVFATPMFFLLPRVGGAGIGGNPGGVSTSSGFSDTVRLGGIGNIQQNDAVVMRVRIEGGAKLTGLRWRGVALDTFDNRSWSRTKAASKEAKEKGERDIIQVDFASGRESLTIQTIYLEPLDTPVLFALPKAVGVQGNFSVLFKDEHDSLTFPRANERITYKVLSDRALPDAARLRSDRSDYSREMDNYLQVPPLIDPRIKELAGQITRGSYNRYDAAKATESYLQNSFGYTLEQKASGQQPLADFLFNVKEGHCEYFATAMAVMLRTEGIATRIVNGFSEGEYNETADAYIVKQKNAHSWVEVYFPGENVWVPFDPTPFAGQSAGGTSAGIAGQFGKYLEALETFWIQYFVAFDNQEQRSLFTSVKKSVGDYQSKTLGVVNQLFDRFFEWWKEVRGDKGIETSFAAAAWGVVYLAAALTGLLLLVWMYRRMRRLKVWNAAWEWLFARRSATIVEFYERMQIVLADKGLKREPHQTPLEFAFAVGMPEAVSITEKYNRVRFGEKNLSRNEANDIETWLQNLEATDTSKAETK